MKILNKSILILAISFFAGCTSQFEEFKGDIDNLTTNDITARYFFPAVQHELWMPPSWNYFFTIRQHNIVYAGYSSYGHKNSWEFPDVVFNTNRSWGASATAWNVWSGYFLKVDGFLRLVEPGGNLENNLMAAVGNIMKSAYFATYTELWGDVPYSEVGQEGVLTPKFDTQEDIMKGVIANLDAAMAEIGDNMSTGIGTNDLGEYDILFGGDLQKWKSFANGLKLRIALRAKGAPGEDFADAAISEALANPLPMEDIKIVKDLNSQWNIAATNGDFYSRYNPASLAMLSDRLINAMRDNDDPRLSAYAEPIPGGEVVFGGYNAATENKEKVDYLLANTLDRAGVPYTKNESEQDLIVSINPGEYYVGQPLRLTDGMKTFLDRSLLSKHHLVTEGSRTIGEEIDKMIMPMSEIYFMQAEAALLGFGGDANSLYRSGIQASFDQWGVADNGYMDLPLATLSGTTEEQLQQLGLQAWLAYYMVDWQGWAIARDFHLEGITDDTPNLPELYSNSLTVGRKYPQRIKYGQPAYNLNGANLQEAISRQGEDTPATALWFTKGSKL
ncbi:MAG: SusD/RagB family nutrient-binding outer membrane lipoprotein [Cyclobacteriaceae bacterium]